MSKEIIKQHRNGLQWWGYLHQNNSVHVKRVVGDNVGDAYNSDFVKHVYGPFEAESREEAKKKIYKFYKVKGYY